MKTPYFKSISKVVNIQENPTAGTVIAKLWKRSQIDFDVIRRVSITSTSDYTQLLQSPNGTDFEFDENVTEQFLYEVGGNIGKFIYRLNVYNNDDSINLIVIMIVILIF